MPGRPSGSTTEEEDENPTPNAAPAEASEDTAEDVATRGEEDKDKDGPLPVEAKDKRKASRPATGAKAAWKQAAANETMPSEKEMLELRVAAKDINRDATVEKLTPRRRARMLSPWSCSWGTLGAFFTALMLMLTVFRSFTTMQLDPKGAAMSWMASAFVRFPDFDTEHTRFATKYSLHLYREMGIDEDPRVRTLPVCGGQYKLANNNIGQRRTRTVHSRERRELQAGPVASRRSRSLLE
jgi:glycosylphosphatidylinositol deacylase